MVYSVETGQGDTRFDSRGNQFEDFFETCFSGLYIQSSARSQLRRTGNIVEIIPCLRPSIDVFVWHINIIKKYHDFGLLFAPYGFAGRYFTQCNNTALQGNYTASISNTLLYPTVPTVPDPMSFI